MLERRACGRMIALMVESRRQVVGAHDAGIAAAMRAW
jgi:hypothetical protein